MAFPILQTVGLLCGFCALITTIVSAFSPWSTISATMNAGNATLTMSYSIGFKGNIGVDLQYADMPGASTTDESCSMNLIGSGSTDCYQPFSKYFNTFQPRSLTDAANYLSCVTTERETNSTTSCPTAYFFSFVSAYGCKNDAKAIGLAASTALFVTIAMLCFGLSFRFSPRFSFYPSANGLCTLASLFYFMAAVLSFTTCALYGFVPATQYYSSSNLPICNIGYPELAVGFSLMVASLSLSVVGILIAYVYNSRSKRVVANTELDDGLYRRML